jgi:hypothetical protein
MVVVFIKLCFGYVIRATVVADSTAIYACLSQVETITRTAAPIMHGLRGTDHRSRLQQKTLRGQKSNPGASKSHGFWRLVAYSNIEKGWYEQCPTPNCLVVGAENVIKVAGSLGWGFNLSLAEASGPPSTVVSGRFVK